MRSLALVLLCAFVALHFCGSALMLHCKFAALTHGILLPTFVVLHFLFCAVFFCYILVPQLLFCMFWLCTALFCTLYFLHCLLSCALIVMHLLLLRPVFVCTL